MTDDRKSGIALIAGSLGAVLTMVIHPAGSGGLTPDQAARVALVSGVAHSLAIISFLVLFIGACGLTRRIASSDRIAFSALVVYGAAAVAVLIAATINGFVIPDILRHMARDAAGNAQQWRIVVDAVFQINQAFSRIFLVASSVSIGMWSVAALRNGGLGRSLAIYGCVVAALLIAGVGVGHLRPDMHGMLIMVATQMIWLFAAGVQLCSGRATAPPDSPAR